MMRAQFILGICLVSLLSCTSNTSQTDTDAKEESLPATTQSDCYTYLKDKDSVSLQVILTNGTATGSLNYNFFEKDKNKGTIQGHMEGDTLLAEYTFMSEGSTSIREVAFLKKEDNLVEGYGEMEEKDNKTVFKDRGKLNFNSGIALTKQACK